MKQNRQNNTMGILLIIFFLIFGVASCDRSEGDDTRLGNIGFRIPESKKMHLLSLCDR